SPIFATEVPLAEMTGAVSDTGKQLGNRHLPLRETLEAAADRDGVRAGPNGEAAGHDRGSARRALCLDVEVGQPHSFSCQLIDVWRRCATSDAPAIDAHLPITEVVHEDEDDVRFLAFGDRCGLTQCRN